MSVSRGNWILLGVRAQPVATTTHTRAWKCPAVNTEQQKVFNRLNFLGFTDEIVPECYKTIFTNIYKNSTCFYGSLFVCNLDGLVASWRVSGNHPARLIKEKRGLGLHQVLTVFINFLTRLAFSEKSHNVT